MRTALFLCLLVAIAACSSEPSSTPTPPLSNTTSSPQLSEPTPPDTSKTPVSSGQSTDLAAPDCSSNEGRAADLCNFELAVNHTMSTMKCLESHTECPKDRDYASCVVSQQSFGCRDGQANAIGACDAITDDSISAPCRLYTSFAYDDITQCAAISDSTAKDICLQGFFDRHLDCTTFNYPCRTTHKLSVSDCAFNDKNLAKACNGIAASNEKTCQESTLPVCDLVFQPTFSYTHEGITYSGLLNTPELDGALTWIKDNTPTDATILASWDHGHRIRSATGRSAVAYNPPINFQPGTEDTKPVFHIGEDLVINDLPYYDTKRYGSQATEVEGLLIASVLTATDPTSALATLRKHNIEYVLSSITDVDTIPLLAAIKPFDETQTPLVDLMNNLAPIEGFTLVYNDSTSSVYMVE